MGIMKIGEALITADQLKKFLDSGRDSRVFTDKDINKLKKKCIDIFIKNGITTFLTYDVYVRINNNFLIITPIFTDDTIEDIDVSKLNIYIYLNQDEQKLLGGKENVQYN